MRQQGERIALSGEKQTPMQKQKMDCNEPWMFTRLYTIMFALTGQLERFQRSLWELCQRPCPLRVSFQCKELHREAWHRVTQGPFYILVFIPIKPLPSME